MIEHVPEILGGIAAVMASGSLILSAMARKHAKATNDAVNNRPGKKIYDIISEIHADSRELITWKRGYDGGPLSTGAKVERFYSEWEQARDAMKCANHIPPSKKSPPPRHDQ